MLIVFLAQVRANCNAKRRLGYAAEKRAKRLDELDRSDVSAAELKRLMDVYDAEAAKKRFADDEKRAARARSAADGGIVPPAAPKTSRLLHFAAHDGYPPSHFPAAPRSNRSRRVFEVSVLPPLQDAQNAGEVEAALRSYVEQLDDDITSPVQFPPFTESQEFFMDCYAATAKALHPDNFTAVNVCAACAVRLPCIPKPNLTHAVYSVDSLPHIRLLALRLEKTYPMYEKHVYKDPDDGRLDGLLLCSHGNFASFVSFVRNNPGGWQGFAPSML